MRSGMANAFGVDCEWTVDIIPRMARSEDLAEVVTISEDTPSLSFILSATS